MNVRRRARLATLAWIAAVATGGSAIPASAAEPQSADAARCALVAADAERLACYDGLFRKAAPEAAFGMERRDTRAPEDLATIRSRITAVQQSRDGALIVTLENGQVWSQRDAKGRVQWAVGDELVVERAALGSFLAAEVGTNRYVRVRRER
jgi:hypothetical protein